MGAGLAIGVLVPTDALAGIAGAHNPLAVPAAAAAGIPLYFGTELFIPIGDALHAKGASTGSIVALVIAGAGATSRSEHCYSTEGLLLRSTAFRCCRIRRTLRFDG